MIQRPKITLKNFSYLLFVLVFLCLLFWLSVITSGCANLDYGDLHYSRAGNWKAELVIFTEHVTDSNGFSDVTIIIIGPDINHDKFVGSVAEGLMKGLK